MALHVTLAEAQTRLAQVLERAEAGDEVVIARDGKPNLIVRVEPEGVAPPQGARGRRLGVWAQYGPMMDPDLFFRPDPELEAAADGPLFPPGS